MRVRDPVVLPGGAIWRGRFDILTRFFHWFTVLFVVVQLASGWSFLLMEKTSFYPLVLLVHRSSGSALWALTVLRLCWRRSFAKFPPFPDRLPHIILWAAKISEYGLYLLLLFVPLTGFFSTVLLGMPFELFDREIPALLPCRTDLVVFFRDLHATCAWTLAGLSGVHALAALFHHLVLKDDVLESMLPGVSRSSSP